MNKQFIQGVLFDWNQIDDGSYLKKLKRFMALKNLGLRIRSHFLSEKMEAENQHYLKRLQWLMVLIPKGVQKIMLFLRMIRILS